ncbi:MAG: ATP-binding cassette domain-containing protein, partial [Pseudomonadota bacterium]|nr:ATP-binding cassette domain-containing protein [Pseudomonadota bacterium]
MNGTLIAADGVSRTFGARGLFGGKPLRAVSDVSFSIGTGEAVGLVGESGSGKSTLGRMLIGLLAPSEGRVLVDGVDLAHGVPRSLRRRLQPVFQDPYSTLDPRRRIGSQIADGLA